MKLRFVYLLLLFVSPGLHAATVTIQGGQTNQVIDGFGVNVNSRSWKGAELEPVLDAFIDQAGMTMFRVVRDLSDWEASDDNNDSSVMDWTYYNTVYSSTEFTRLWDMFGYLNSRGITNGALFNFMGWGPSWMMGNDGRTLKAGMEAEWAEMIASAVIYARNTRGLQFSLLAPNNEPDILNEGIKMDATPYVNSLHQLALKLDASGLGDVRFIGPDRAGGGTGYMPEMLADPVVMGKVKHFGVHSYSSGGGGSGGVLSYIKGSAYPDRTFWMTEFNVWCSGCDTGSPGPTDWTYARGTAEYLLSHLLNGASACFPWEGYDSIYAHHGYLWSYWGLIGVDNINAAVKTYTARKNFYTVAQISKWVRPGAQRINISGSTSPFTPLLAFKHTGLGQVTIVGINTSGSTATLNGTLASMAAVPSLNLYYTSASANLADGGSVAVNNGTFSATIPANCVFTLVGLTGVQVVLSNPVNGAQFNAPATIPLAATATTTAGNVALVEFYNGPDWLGDDSLAPFELVWSNVPMGDYSLTAVATDTFGNMGTSGVVKIAVVGDLANLIVTPTNATIAPDGVLQFIATGTDMLGHVLNPQPGISWSVSGGGTITVTGLFTAGGIAGGPFEVIASSGDVTGTAVVSVADSSGGWIIGNTNNGALSDSIWDDTVSIKAGRFQAGQRMTVTGMYAQVERISGNYKCAIYSDSNSQPHQLLGLTSEAANPDGGWQAFPLSAPVALTNGQYYWLAIWSDDAEARVYYSDANGMLRWGDYDYGPWPDFLSTGVGSTLNYCIYATNTSSPLGVASVNLPPTKVGVVYSFQMTASGGLTPYTWAMAVNASPPAGLSLSTNGVLSGVPSSAGQFSFPVVVTDAADMTASQTVSLEISEPILTLGALLQTASEIADQGFRLTVSADVPGTYLIQRTADFSTWVDVQELNYTAGVAQVTDNGTTTNSTLFYRAVRR